MSGPWDHTRQAGAGSSQTGADAKGSCGELRTQLYIGIEAGYLPRDKARRWTEETRHLSAMLFRLIQAWRTNSRSV